MDQDKFLATDSTAGPNKKFEQNPFSSSEDETCGWTDPCTARSFYTQSKERNSLEEKQADRDFKSSTCSYLTFFLPYIAVHIRIVHSSCLTLQYMFVSYILLALYRSTYSYRTFFLPYIAVRVCTVHSSSLISQYMFVSYIRLALRRRTSSYRTVFLPYIAVHVRIVHSSCLILQYVIVPYILLPLYRSTLSYCTFFLPYIAVRVRSVHSSQDMFTRTAFFSANYSSPNYYS
jgi:uncharacterized membrane protein YqaE (UPF0057 family)